MRKKCTPKFTPQERFWQKVNKTENCWEWTAQIVFGYGKFRLEPRPAPPRHAHRVSYEWAYGPIPKGLLVCHHCDNPRCVRPDHLFLGTHKDNTEDMMSKGRGNFHGATKLTDIQVLEIRDKYASGAYRLEDLGQEYGVHFGHISLLVLRKRRKNI